MASKSGRCAVCLGALLACAAVARPASAWEATQVTLQTTLFAYQKTSVTLDGSNNSESVSLTSFGLFGSGVGAGIGYAWDSVGFGVRTNVQNVSEGSESATALSLFPRLEYQANPGKSGAFVAALAGVTYLSLGDTSTTAFGFGGSLGAHGFIDPAVSIDPELTVLGSTGSESFSGGGSDASASQTGVQVLFTLGLSGWINSKHSSRFEPPPPETVNAPPSAAPSGDEDEGDKHLLGKTGDSDAPAGAQAAAPAPPAGPPSEPAPASAPSAPAPPAPPANAPPTGTFAPTPAPAPNAPPKK